MAISLQKLKHFFSFIKFDAFFAVSNISLIFYNGGFKQRLSYTDSNDYPLMKS